ncbi:hydroxymethylglutaryl-CoA synthase family protein [Apilactobacillus quenuiae]|uniref:hydroxymethylglutaryl-CoA synthase family protein n=1 Tax=Apilactobacillus quenuiae TaxID=2008377 RepID=UPI000D01FB30|nr:hydroxymethylglutaryl-CoA synthase family protein [Apilactobacillus quenuiae]
MDNAIGIVGMSNYIPKHWIASQTILNFWHNSNWHFLKAQIGIESRNVIGCDEDALTLAMAAINKMIRCEYLAPKIPHLDSLILGSTTMPELYRCNAIQLKEMFLENSKVWAQDIQDTENGAVMGLVNAYSLIHAKISKNVLVVGSDTLGRHIEPGNLREYYAGSAAASIYLGNDNVIATIDQVTCISSDFPEVARPEDERFFRNLTSLNSKIIDEGMIKHCVKAFKTCLAKSKSCVSDYTKIILPEVSLNGKSRLAKALNISAKQLLEISYFKELGELGCAGAFVSLQVALSQANANDKILLISYGHSAQAICISLTVTDFIKQYWHQVSQANTLSQVSRDPQFKVNYAEMLQAEDKMVQSNQAFDSFL